VLRGSAQNPDVYFQARETVNRYYAAAPAIVQAAMDKFAQDHGTAVSALRLCGGIQTAERVLIHGLGR